MLLLQDALGLLRRPRATLARIDGRRGSGHGLTGICLSATLPALVAELAPPRPHSGPTRPRRSGCRGAFRGCDHGPRAAGGGPGLDRLMADRFPHGFLWGTATAAHQVEGNNHGNDWWDWEQPPGAIRSGDRSDPACDHFQRFQDDFDLLRSLHQNAHRFSLEWSRIEPQDGV